MTLPLGITRSLGPTKRKRPFLPFRFHLCSNCHSYSLASICPYTPHWIPVQLNLPYAHLRYLFEGYRPSQTNTVTPSPSRASSPRGEWPPFSGWYFTDASLVSLRSSHLWPCSVLSASPRSALRLPFGLPSLLPCGARLRFHP